MFDGKALGEQLTVVVRDFVTRALAPIVDRIKVLEERPAPERGEKGDTGEPGRDGKDADPALIRSEVERAVAAIPRPKDGAPGERGEKGEPGARGERGEKGEAGKEGPAGRDGAPGKSAYELAVERGYPGTELQWLDSLKGARGEPGAAGRDGEQGPAGKDADPERVAALVAEGVARELPGAVQRAIDALMPDLVARAAQAVPRPRDGKDAPPIDREALVREVVALIPAPRDGRDADPVDTAALAREVLALVPVPRDGRDGKDAEPVSVEQLRLLVDAAVETRMALLPVPKDGRDAEPVDVEAIVREVCARVPAPRDGKDAPPVDEDAIVERVRALIPTPKDGRDGADGSSVTIDDLRPLIEGETARWQLEFERRATDTLRDAIEKMPRPLDGKDGRDALQLEDFEVRLEGRVFTFALRAGERVVERQIKVPFPIDRGVYRAGAAYEKGDVVTYGGSQWIALADNAATKPPSDDWRCQVQRGRDAKGAR